MPGPERRTSSARWIAYNTVAQITSRLIVAGLTLAILRLSTRYLGPQSYGRLVTITSFVTVFSALADWGLAVIAAREMARDQERSSELLGLNLGLRFTISLVAIPLVLILAWLLYADATPEVRTGIALLSVTLLTNAVATSAGAIFVARVRNDITGAIEVVTRILWLLGVVVIIETGSAFFAFIWLQVGISLILAAGTVLVAKRFVAIRPIFRLKLWREIIRMSLPLGIVHAINLVYFRLDVVIISLLRTPTEVAHYSVAYRVIDLVMAIPGFLMVAVMPSLVTADEERLKQLLQRAFDVLASLAIPILVGGLLLRTHLVVAISSPEFVAAAAPLTVLMFGAALSFLSAVFGHTLIALGFQARLIPVAVVGLSLNLVLNLVLVPAWGATGAAVATATTEVVALGYVAILFRRSTGLVLSLRLVPRFLLAGSVMALAGWAALRIPFVREPSLASVAILGSVLGAVYFLTLAAARGLPVPSVRAIIGRRGS